MFTSLPDSSIFAAILGGWEVVLILAVPLILAAARLPWLTRFLKGFDQGSYDLGKSLGGIFGKPAAQALTPDNQTSELYDPAAFRKTDGSGRPFRRTWLGRCRRLWRRGWHSLLQRLREKGSASQ
jgi:hypothetical protein